METSVTNYRDYVITTKSGVERGIFFRSPIQSVGYDGYSWQSKFSPWNYMEAIKNPIRRLYEILIGNGNIVKNIKNWAREPNFGGFRGNIICFPIYFKRDYRSLLAESTGTGNIKKIKSYGYESEYCTCGGECKVEKTKVWLKNGKVIHLRENELFHYTYLHIVKDIIDSGEIKK